MHNSYHNPYAGADFFQFFQLLFSRLFHFIAGDLPLNELASDEVQVFTLSAVAISSSLLGTFLVLKRMTMLANSLSHTILVGIVIAYVLTRQSATFSTTFSPSVLLLASLIMAFITTLLTQFCTAQLQLQEDASTGLIFTSLFALGIILVTLLTRSAHVGAEVMMGNVDSLNFNDLSLVIWIAAINLGLVFLLFKEYQVVAFDPAYAQILGIPTQSLNYLLMAQVALAAVGAFRAIGVLLYLALIAGPPLTARFFTDHLRSLIMLAISLSLLACLLGVATARHLLSLYGLALSTGGLVVCYIALLFIVALLYSHLRLKRLKGSEISPL